MIRNWHLHMNGGGAGIVSRRRSFGMELNYIIAFDGCMVNMQSVSFHTLNVNYNTEAMGWGI
jgi:hypothetical protein